LPTAVFNLRLISGSQKQEMTECHRIKMKPDCRWNSRWESICFVLCKHSL